MFTAPGDEKEAPEQKIPESTHNGCSSSHVFRSCVCPVWNSWEREGDQPGLNHSPHTTLLAEFGWILFVISPTWKHVSESQFTKAKDTFPHNKKWMPIPKVWGSSLYFWCSTDPWRWCFFWTVEVTNKWWTSALWSPGHGAGLRRKALFSVV